MQIETAIGLVMREIARTEEIHPRWPKDVVRAGAVVAEEAGELLQACNNFDEKPDTSKTMMMTEAIHTAATALRFLKNMEE